MKKSMKIFAALSVVALVFSGCITATVLMTKWAVDEEKEIESGSVFKESEATIIYSCDGWSEGMTLRFKDYGKYIRIDKHNTDFIIITPDSVYKGNVDNKTYVAKYNDDGEMYYTNISMVFPVEWFRWEKFAEYMVDDTNKKEGSEYIHDRKCVTFTDNDYKVAGYKRIYMYKEINGSIKFNARQWKQGCEAEFAPPANCKRVSGSIDYEVYF